MHAPHKGIGMEGANLQDCGPDTFLLCPVEACFGHGNDSAEFLGFAVFVCPRDGVARRHIRNDVGGL